MVHPLLPAQRNDSRALQLLGQLCGQGNEAWAVCPPCQHRQGYVFGIVIRNTFFWDAGIRAIQIHKHLLAQLVLWDSKHQS